MLFRTGHGLNNKCIEPEQDASDDIQASLKENREWLLRERSKALKISQVNTRYSVKPILRGLIDVCMRLESPVTGEGSQAPENLVLKASKIPQMNTGCSLVYVVNMPCTYV